MNAIQDIERILYQESNFILSFDYWDIDMYNKRQKLLNFSLMSTTTTNFMLRYLMTLKRDELGHTFKNGPIKILCGKGQYSRIMKKWGNYESPKKKSIEDELMKWKIVIRLEQDQFNEAVWCLNRDDVLLFYKTIPPVDTKTTLYRDDQFSSLKNIKLFLFSYNLSLLAIINKIKHCLKKSKTLNIFFFQSKHYFGHYDTVENKKLIKSKMYESSQITTKIAKIFKKIFLDEKKLALSVKNFYITCYQFLIEKKLTLLTYTFCMAQNDSNNNRYFLEHNVSELAFIAIDCEFTGLLGQYEKQVIHTQTPSEALQTSLLGASDFCISQLGIALFFSSEENPNLYSYPFNFLLYPNFGSELQFMDELNGSFVVQAQSLQFFLASHGYHIKPMSPLSGCTKQKRCKKKKSKHNTYIHIYIYIFIYVYVYVCDKLKSETKIQEYINKKLERLLRSYDKESASTKMDINAKVSTATAIATIENEPEINLLLSKWLTVFEKELIRSDVGFDTIKFTDIPSFQVNRILLHECYRRIEEHCRFSSSVHNFHDIQARCDKLVFALSPLSANQTVSYDFFCFKDKATATQILRLLFFFF
ncbi:poly(A)-specific ribonuclease (PARN)-like domain containing 1 [Reticulomyxa filosa]|uniref:Poly(A)-specific ribonuclease (PARN)-like domain containing 1 n=1 Tax=Reticulomyxa filosa TaxID=46433 RepID=X6P7D3_RETFI|nr:poly(A)-specific ribonuclease (PARN)-like domain containing 1 [Reticulomyxa filosa]|eukprot:ETO33969.1 poly(A)-specific ribonuclease (PARN)-like domain containing 1 [Reticulomyxa filosa]